MRRKNPVLIFEAGTVRPTDRAGEKVVASRIAELADKRPQVANLCAALRSTVEAIKRYLPIEGEPFPYPRRWNYENRCAHVAVRKSIAELQSCLRPFQLQSDPNAENVFFSNLDAATNILVSRARRTVKELSRWATADAKTLPVCPKELFLSLSSLAAELEKQATPAISAVQQATRIVVNGDDVFLDGKTVQLYLTPECRTDALVFLRVLSREWQSSTDICKKEPNLKGTRLDRLRKSLPVSLQGAIKSNRRKGYRLTTDTDSP